MHTTRTLGGPTLRAWLLVGCLGASGCAQALTQLEPGRYAQMGHHLSITWLADNVAMATLKSVLNADAGTLVQTIQSPQAADIVHRQKVTRQLERCVPSAGPAAGAFCPLVSKRRPDGFWDFVATCDAATIIGTGHKVALVPGSANLWEVTYSMQMAASAAKPANAQDTLKALEELYKNAKPTNAEEAQQVAQARAAFPQARAPAAASDETRATLLAQLKADKLAMRPEQWPAQDKLIASIENPNARITLVGQVTETLKRLSTTCDAAAPIGNPPIRRPKPDPKTPDTK